MTRTRHPGAILLTLGGLILTGWGTGSVALAADTRASGAGVELLVPEGWTSREVEGRGLVVASSEADLDSDVPAGPRVVAGASGVELPDPVSLFATSRAEQATIRGEPQQITNAGQPAVVIETGSVRGGVPIISRVTTVSDEAGTGYTITAEAPEGQWDVNVAALDKIVSSVRFVGGGGGAGLLLLLLVLAIGGGVAAAVVVRRRRKALVTVPSQDASPGAIPADWYPDPSGEARLRYWDGAAWTDHTSD
ncbi:MAG: DUF2510 domain-containing protein [Actinomycetota bacterium]